MGIRGRFLTLAAAASACHSSASSCSPLHWGKLAGFIAMLVMIIAGLVTIYIKQRGGLHNKRKDKGVFVYKSLRKKS